jgi:hypothetical protein
MLAGSDATHVLSRHGQENTYFCRVVGDLAKERVIGAPTGPRLRYDASFEGPWAWSAENGETCMRATNNAPDSAKKDRAKPPIDEMVRPTWGANLPADGVALHAPGVRRPAERTIHAVPAHSGEPPERPPIYDVQIVTASTQPREDIGF